MISKSCADKEVMRRRERTRPQKHLCSTLLSVESSSIFAGQLSFYWFTVLYTCTDPYSASIHTLPYVHKQHSSVSSLSSSERMGTASFPRDWWHQRSQTEAESVTELRSVCVCMCVLFLCFTTLQDSLLICCAVCGIWIVKASITIIAGAASSPLPRVLSLTAPSGRSPSGPLVRFLPSVHFLLPPLLIATL